MAPRRMSSEKRLPLPGAGAFPQGRPVMGLLPAAISYISGAPRDAGDLHSLSIGPRRVLHRWRRQLSVSNPASLTGCRGAHCCDYHPSNRQTEVESLAAQEEQLGSYPPQTHRDNDGVTALSMQMDPEKAAILHRATDCRAKMSAAEQNQRELYTCAACDKDLTAQNPKRCAACRLVAYCSKECQKAHWKAHKKDCAAAAAAAAAAEQEGAAGGPGSAGDSRGPSTASSSSQHGQ